MNIAQIVGDAPPVRCPYGEEIVVGEVIHSYATVLAWTEECRNESGLYTIQPPAAAPDGERIVSTDLALIDGQVVDVPTYEALQAMRREIPKSVIQARLIAAGKMDAVFAALMSSPADFAKWFAPDWPNVFADDERMVEVLTALDADVETITAP